MEGKLGMFLILSFLPSQPVAPHSAQGWHLNYNVAELADKENTGKCKQKPLLFWSVCGTFHTDATRETVTIAGSAAQAGPPRSSGPLPSLRSALAWRGQEVASVVASWGLVAPAPHALLGGRLRVRQEGVLPSPQASSPRRLQGPGS